MTFPSPRDARSAVAFRDDRGATTVEYAVIAALIAAVIAVTVQAIGIKLIGMFDLPAPF